MDYSYAHLIEQEQAKIALLQAKIVECERRIEALKSFLNADELDTLLAKSLYPSHQKMIEQEAIPVQTTCQAVLDQESYEDPKRRLSEDVQSILRFVGVAGKSLDELEAYCRSQAYGHNRASLRSMMSNYKIKHGFIDSPEQGFFKLTTRALAFLDAHYPVAIPPNETPSVGAEGVSDT
ncbi:hypothetical protein [Laribacter hongkongensis]|uniref:hypothetical protein n=1 Tax=Laribacter hongkongensis TaxID=168471 RepID=UPI001EFC8414|nr:hypothetical protein [Laribacter hongkongensis]MCG9078922.1 hypothetical protein [Laribacter hongkongensis]